MSSPLVHLHHHYHHRHRRVAVATLSSTASGGVGVGGGGGGGTGAGAGPAGLSRAGVGFFGGLCVATFGLGCWQLQRLQEKRQLMRQRADELQQPPTSAAAHPGTFRRIRALGRYDHSKEFLVGPRGAPPPPPPGGGGTRTGTGSGTGNGNGGSHNMPTSQGYYVVTPFRVQKRKDQGDGGEEVEEIWLVNRGWVPRSLVVGGDNSKAGLAAERQATKPTAATAATNYHREPRRLDWYRPTGPAQVLRAVPAVLEKPRFLVAQPNYAERPIQFYWFDVETMGRLLQIDEEKNRPPPLVVAYNDDDDDDDDDDDNNNNSNSSASKPQQAPAAACYPRRPHLASLQEFKTSPAIHAAYALTWFSLSVLGTVMTRRLYLGRPGW